MNGNGTYPVTDETIILKIADGDKAALSELY